MVSIKKPKNTTKRKPILFLRNFIMFYSPFPFSLVSIIIMILAISSTERMLPSSNHPKNKVEWEGKIRSAVFLSIRPET
jgi:hypothetical protein